MFKIIVTIILTSAFFILFFVSDMKGKKKKIVKEEEEPSTTKGFIEDTYRGPITDRFIPPKPGKIGTFVGYTNVPDHVWLSGFPTN
jgi:hypothetical protein